MKDDLIVGLIFGFCLGAFFSWMIFSFVGQGRFYKCEDANRILQIQLDRCMENIR